jgi:hypothetical protein
MLIEVVKYVFFDCLATKSTQHAVQSTLKHLSFLLHTYWFLLLAEESVFSALFTFYGGFLVLLLPWMDPNSRYPVTWQLNVCFILQKPTFFLSHEYTCYFAQPHWMRKSTSEHGTTRVRCSAQNLFLCTQLDFQFDTTFIWVYCFDPLIKVYY